MEGYEFGKDIQEIKEALKRIESILGTDSTQGRAPIPTGGVFGVSLDIGIDVRRDGTKVCATVKISIDTPLGSRGVSLPEVCLGSDGVCSSVTTGDTNPFANANVCWRGDQVCADVTAGVKIAGRTFSASGTKCVGI